MWLWGSLLAFYFIVALLDICGKFKRTNKKRLTGILLLPMFILVAFRALSVGPDTYSYSLIYELTARQDSLIEWINYSRMESGYVFFSYLFSKLGFSYLGFQVAVSLFIYFSFGRFICNHSKYIAVSCFLLFANHMFGTMNQVRMWLAAAVLLYAIEALLNDRFIKFIIIVCLATCFHLTAAVFLIAYPLKKMKWNGVQLILAAGITIIITYFAESLFAGFVEIFDRYESYASRFEYNNLLATRLTLIVQLAFFVFVSVIYKSNRLIGQNGEKTIYGLTYTMHVICVCIAVIGLSNNIMGRVSPYFSVFDMLSIPLALNTVKNARNRVIISIVILACISLKLIVILKFRPEWYMVIPYSFY